ncbi:hypothetical protein PC116_g9801 [Phytophthora cactorum]|nr:hypothetical protein PC111_g11688 [Phytophthora cactorum]KAG3157291.1 hypothetical protein C6341_g14780 [Phytophthora cactorum]KAG4242302.1 hypothetical protein PC116_g9801 [Phytophthora cactorum]
MSRPRLIQARRDAQLSRAWTRLCRGLPQRSGICGRIRRGVEGAGVPYMCRLTSQGANKDSGFLYPQPNGEVEDKAYQITVRAVARWRSSKEWSHADLKRFK